MEPSTIAAIATPIGRGGIGIIRISGPDAFAIGISIFRRKHPRTTEQRKQYNFDETGLTSHRLYHGYIFDPEADCVLDEILLAYMRSPNSYTREDVVEIQTHGNAFVLNQILELVLRSGARLADPGEFTRRAFLNGRIDLTQAEAVADIINARSASAVKIGAAQISGALSDAFRSFKERLLETQVHIEASIDFPEDTEDNTASMSHADAILDVVLNDMNRIIDQYSQGVFLREGIKIVILGAPNVGKSSLMNRLLKSERSIVAHIPGTTRDFIEDSFYVDGIPIRIIDTAGIHSTPDPVEKIGIQRAIELAETADLVLFVVEAGRQLDRAEVKMLQDLSSAPKCVVVNKIDLYDEVIENTIPETVTAFHPLQISALQNKGIDQLKQTILKMCLRNEIEAANVSPNLRQKNALSRSRDACLAAKAAIAGALPEEIVSIDIQEAIRGLNEILGESVHEEVLDRIFSSFCIGK